MFLFLVVLILELAYYNNLFTLLILCVGISSYNDNIYIDYGSNEEIQFVQKNDIEDHMEEVQVLHEARNESENQVDGRDTIIQ
jgi:hypothetical protein